MKLLLEAEVESEATIMKAKAQAEAVRVIAEELQKPSGDEAARLALASSYAEIYGEMGKSSNTMLFQQNPGDVNALLAQAAAAMKIAGGSAEK